MWSVKNQPYLDHRCRLHQAVEFSLSRIPVDGRICEHRLPKLGFLNNDRGRTESADARRYEDPWIAQDVGIPVTTSRCSRDDEPSLDVEPPDLDGSTLSGPTTDGRHFDGARSRKGRDRVGRGRHGVNLQREPCLESSQSCENPADDETTDSSRVTVGQPRQPWMRAANRRRSSSKALPLGGHLH